jgi:DEAD/DEAH box helicase domain-containing protein
MNYVVFDIETYSPSESNKIDTKELRSAVACAYISWEDRYVGFFENQIEKLLEIFIDADLVVGYNHLWFDLPVLQKYSSFNLLDLCSYDIMIEFEKKAGFKAKLDDLAKATLGTAKTDSYEVYRYYYKDGKWFELLDYCMHDVQITHELFLKNLRGEKLFYQDVSVLHEFVLDEPQPGQRKVFDMGSSALM